MEGDERGGVRAGHADHRDPGHVAADAAFCHAVADAAVAAKHAEAGGLGGDLQGGHGAADGTEATVAPRGSSPRWPAR